MAANAACVVVAWCRACVFRAIVLESIIFNYHHRLGIFDHKSVSSPSKLSLMAHR